MKKRIWKGAALTVEDVGKLPRLLPVEQDLALRGMVEQVDHKAVYSNSKCKVFLCEKYRKAGTLCKGLLS